MASWECKQTIINSKSEQLYFICMENGAEDVQDAIEEYDLGDFVMDNDYNGDLPSENSTEYVCEEFDDQNILCLSYRKLEKQQINRFEKKKITWTFLRFYLRQSSFAHLRNDRANQQECNDLTTWQQDFYLDNMGTSVDLGSNADEIEKNQFNMCSNLKKGHQQILRQANRDFFFMRTCPASFSLIN